jgi:hypothetical protein
MAHVGPRLLDRLADNTNPGMAMVPLWESKQGTAHGSLFVAVFACFTFGKIMP